MKRVIAIVLALVLALSICPAVFAEGPALHDAEGHVLSDSAVALLYEALDADDVITADGCVYRDGNKIGSVHVDEQFDVYTVEWDYIIQPRTILNVPMVTQKGKYDCWAACIAMILKYRTGQSVMTSQIVYAGYGITSGSADKPGNWEYFKRACNAFGLSTARNYGPMSYAQVEAQIERDCPMVVVCKTGTGETDGHDMVLHGCNPTSIATSFGYTYSDPYTGKVYTNISSANPLGFYFDGVTLLWEDTYWGFYVM